MDSNKKVNATCQRTESHNLTDFADSVQPTYKLIDAHKDLKSTQYKPV